MTATEQGFSTATFKIWCNLS